MMPCIKYVTYNKYNLLNLFDTPPSLYISFSPVLLTLTSSCHLMSPHYPEIVYLVTPHLCLSSSDSGLCNKSTFFPLKSIGSCWIK